MQSLIQIFQFLFTLFASTFLLRFIAQWVRADFRNPISQAIMQITSPLLIPVRRIIPGWKGKDTASLLLFFLLMAIGTVLTGLLHGGKGATEPLFLLVMTLYNTFSAVLNLYFYIFIVSAILSWVNQNPYNPVYLFLNSLTTPILRPLRRFIPLIGNTIDITPMIAILVIFFLQNESPNWFNALYRALTMTM